jgi:NAD dependent epimerase/dehydratase
MKVLVTGADGFIGSHLCECLVRNGLDVRALSLYSSLNTHGWLDTCATEDLKEIDIVSGDIRDAEFVRQIMKNCDAVLHLAALIAIPYSYKSPRSFVETNVIGTLNVLEGARDNQLSHVIQLSTSEVYGSAVNTPMSEQHRLHAQSPYAATKIGADQLALSYYRSFGTPVTVIRPFNTFGPRQSLRAVIPTIINQVLAGEQEISLGSLSTIRDFTFVTDTAEALRKTLEVDPRSIAGEEFNLGVGTGHSIADVVQIVSELTETEIRIKTDVSRLRPELSEVDRLVSDNSRARAVLDWQPQYAGVQGFRDALRLTIDWFRENRHLSTYSADSFVV